MSRTNELVLSTGTMPDALKKRYHDLEAVAEVIEQIPACMVELVLHPDWRAKEAPRSKQPDPYSASQCYSPPQLVDRLNDLLKTNSTEICSIHANRDLGAFLASNDRMDLKVGRNILENTVRIAAALKAKMVVVHAWDSWADNINIEQAANILTEISNLFPGIIITVENIPISARNWTQTKIMRKLDALLPDQLGFTFDLSWSSMYANFSSMLEFMTRFTNVHIQGRLSQEDNSYVLLPREGDLNIGDAVRLLRERGYCGQWTLELNKVRSIANFRTAVRHLNTIFADDK